MQSPLSGRARRGAHRPGTRFAARSRYCDSEYGAAVAGLAIGLFVVRATASLDAGSALGGDTSFRTHGLHNRAIRTPDPQIRSLLPLLALPSQSSQQTLECRGAVMPTTSDLFSELIIDSLS
jgi:hypothetical protein